MKGEGGGKAASFSSQTTHDRRPSFIFENAKQCAVARSHWRHSIREGSHLFSLLSFSLYHIRNSCDAQSAVQHDFGIEWRNEVNNMIRELRKDNRITDYASHDMPTHFFYYLQNLFEVNLILFHISWFQQLHPQWYGPHHWSIFKLHLTQNNLISQKIPSFYF